MPGTTQTQDFRKMRVDQVGSLAAPQKLRAAFKQFKNAEIDREELAPFQDDAIREVIQGQEAIGFPIITDGEFRRSNFQESFGAAVTGFHVAKEDKAMEGVNTNPFKRAEQNFEAPGAPIISRGDGLSSASSSQKTFRSRSTYSARKLRRSRSGKRFSARTASPSASTSRTLAMSIGTWTNFWPMSSGSRAISSED